MYNSFKTTKNKLEKLWNNIKENSSFLDNILALSNTIKGQKEQFKIPHTLYDSGWIAKEVNWNLNSTIEKNPRVGNITYTINQELEIPERLLPFIEPVILTKGTPEAKFISDINQKTTSYDDDFYEIKGDGELIYQGTEFTINAVFTQESLDEGKFLESHTKKLWEMTYEYTDGGEHFRIVGTVGRIFIEENQGTGCDGNAQSDQYVIDVDENFGSSDNEHRLLNFTNISDTSIDIGFIGDLFELRWVQDITCDFVSTATHNINTTKNIPNDATNFYSIRFGLDARKFTLESPGGNVISSETFSGDTIVSSTIDTVTKISVEFLGYKLYYSDETKFRTGIKVESGERLLDNLPDSSTSLPFTEITFKRNPNDNPLPVISDFIANGLKEHIWMKTSKKTDAITKYNIRCQGRLYLLGNATEESFITRDVYNDIYTSDGGSPTETYERTTTNHTTKNLSFFKPKETDVQFRLILGLKNPLYWNEIRKYTINET